MSLTTAEYEAYLNSIPMKDIKLLGVGLIRHIRNLIFGRSKLSYIQHLLEHTYIRDDNIYLKDKTITGLPIGDGITRDGPPPRYSTRKVRSDAGTIKNATKKQKIMKPIVEEIAKKVKKTPSSKFIPITQAVQLTPKTAPKPRVKKPKALSATGREKRRDAGKPRKDRSIISMPSDFKKPQPQFWEGNILARV